MAKRKVFSVEVCRTGYAFCTIHVETTSQEKANEEALDMAGDFDYSEKSSEYSLCSKPSTITALSIGTADARWTRIFSTREKAVQYAVEEGVAHVGFSKLSTPNIAKEIHATLDDHNFLEFRGMSFDIEENLTVQ